MPGTFAPGAGYFGFYADPLAAPHGPRVIRARVGSDALEVIIGLHDRMTVGRARFDSLEVIVARHDGMTAGRARHDGLETATTSGERLL